MFFLIFGCVESELIIPGENVGVGDDSGENPTLPLKLQTFNYTSTLSTYQFSYDADGVLSQSSAQSTINSSTYNAANTYTWTNQLISQISSTPAGTFSGQSTLTYNDQQQLVEINAGTTPESKLVISYDAANITATRFVDGTEENVYTFTTDTYGYINAMQVTDQATGSEIQVSLNMNANLVNSSELRLNGTSVYAYNFTYDNKSNPVFSQTIDSFNTLVLNDAFEMDASNLAFNLDKYAMLRSTNNITAIEITEGSNTTTLEYEYTYNADNLPEAATTTVAEGEVPSTFTYSYY